MRYVIILAIVIIISGVSYAFPPVPSSDSQVAYAMQQLHDPIRHDIHLAGADISTAVTVLSSLYSWFPNTNLLSPMTIARLDGLSIDIDMQQASLAEVLAFLCNQTGMRVSKRFENLGIYGGIGREEIGGRNLVCAEDGLLMILSASRFLPDTTSSYSIHANVVSSVPWITHNDARFDLRALCYPDGTTLTNLGVNKAFRLSLDPLVSNSGNIASIEGIFQIPIPMRAVTQNIFLEHVELPHEERADNHLIRINSITNTDAGWILSYEYGFFTIGNDQPDYDYGHVDVIDINGQLLLGGDQRPGSSGFWADGIIASNESCRTLRATYQAEPRALQWTYVAESRELSIPCVFTNCRIPDVIWKE